MPNKEVGKCREATEQDPLAEELVGVVDPVVMIAVIGKAVVEVAVEEIEVKEAEEMELVLEGEIGTMPLKMTLRRNNYLTLLLQKAGFLY
ncbi:MAG: hypothetical protein U9P90_03015 [Patescibacteria group bacterium]|nr:hypothetical protein [Patescibacteria group bacterium]